MGDRSAEGRDQGQALVVKVQSGCKTYGVSREHKDALEAASLYVLVDYEKGLQAGSGWRLQMHPDILHGSPDPSGSLAAS